MTNDNDTVNRETPKLNIHLHKQTYHHTRKKNATKMDSSREKVYEWDRELDICIEKDKKKGSVASQKWLYSLPFIEYEPLKKC